MDTAVSNSITSLTDDNNSTVANTFEVEGPNNIGISTAEDIKKAKEEFDRELENIYLKFLDKLKEIVKE